jgi:hypothetical protein
MKTEITIKYNNGDEAIYTTKPVDYAKWEKETGKTISQLTAPGIWDIMFLAYSAMKRESAGKPVKSLDVWMETVSEFEVGADSPKAIQSEA